MKLAIFNGSPRGVTSNTKTLLQCFQKGFEYSGGEITTLDYLIKEKELKRQVQNFRDAENILLAFPLYVDSVPGIVKQFIEEVGNFDGSGKNIIFFIHSGFPEAIHSEALGRYLELLVKRWGMKHLGTILKPGTEQIRMRPGERNQDLYQDFEQLGRTLAKSGELNQKILTKFKELYVFPKYVATVIRLVKKLGIFDKYWKRELKKNKAFQRSFDKPLLE